MKRRPPTLEEPEQVAESLGQLEPVLDEVARARIQARLFKALDEQPSIGRAGSLPMPRWGSTAAAPMALAAVAVVAVASGLAWTSLRGPAQAPIGEQAAAPSPGAPASSAAGPQATAQKAKPAPWPPMAAMPYCASGASAEALATDLGQGRRRLDVPADTQVHASLGPHARATLAGPVTLTVERLSADHIEVSLARGQLALTFEGDGQRSLHVRTSYGRVAVVGTALAVDAQAQQARVAVAHGAVEVRFGGQRARVEGGQVLETRAGAAEPLADADPLAHLLKQHADAIPPPPRAHRRLRVKRSGDAMSARLGDRGLGTTPVWALVPDVPIDVTLHAPPRAGRTRPASASRKLTGAAREATAQGTTTDPRRVPAETPAARLYGLAEACMARDDSACAERWLTQLLARHESSAEAGSARYDLGRLAWHAGRYETARKHLSELGAQAGPFSAPARYLLCRIALKTNQDDSETCLRRFIADFPHSHHAPELRALLAARVFDSKGCTAAQPLLRDYLARHPGGPFGDGARDRLRRCAEAPATEDK